jgi:predicted transcriptional regulator
MSRARDIAVYTTIRAEPDVTASDLVQRCGMNANTLKHVLRRLKARGQVTARQENWAEHDGRSGPRRWRWRVTR